MRDSPRSPKGKTNGSRFEGNRPEVLISGFNKQTNKYRFALIHRVPVDANKLARAKVRGNHGTRIC